MRPDHFPTPRVGFLSECWGRGVGPASPDKVQ